MIFHYFVVVGGDVRLFSIIIIVIVFTAGDLRVSLVFIAVL